jgi:hypothetical protein
MTAVFTVIESGSQDEKSRAPSATVFFPSLPDLHEPRVAADKVYHVPSTLIPSKKSGGRSAEVRQNRSRNPPRSSQSADSGPASLRNGFVARPASLLENKRRKGCNDTTASVLCSTYNYKTINMNTIVLTQHHRFEGGAIPLRTLRTYLSIQASERAREQK